MPVTSVAHIKNGRALIAYLLSKKGHNGHENRNEMISYFNLVPNVSLVTQFDQYWLRARSNHLCQMQAIYQSFSANELSSENPEDIKTAHDIGYETGCLLFPDRQWFLVTQIDGKGGYIHNHLAASDVDIYEYKGCSENQKNWKNIKKISDEISSKYITIDPRVLKKYKDVQKYTHTEQGLRENGEYCWKDDIRERIEIARDEAGDIDDFVIKCQKYGVKAEKKHRKKTDKDYFTYTLMDYKNAPSDFKQSKGYREPKIRSYNLEDEYDYDGIVDYIQNNKSASKTVNNNGSGSGPDLSTCCTFLCDYADNKLKHRKYPNSCFSSLEYYNQINQMITNNQMQINTIQILMAVLNVLGKQKQAKVYQRMLYDLIDEQRRLRRERAQKSIEAAEKRKAEHPIRRSPRRHFDIDEIVNQADELNQSVDEIKL